MAGLDPDRTGLEGRVVASQRLEHLDFEQRDLARIWLGRVRAGSQKIPVALDPATCNEVALVEFLHRARRRGCDMDVQEPPAPPSHAGAVAWKGRRRREQCRDRYSLLRRMHPRLPWTCNNLPRTDAIVTHVVKLRGRSGYNARHDP